VGLRVGGIGVEGGRRQSFRQRSSEFKKQGNTD